MLCTLGAAEQYLKKKKKVKRLLCRNSAYVGLSAFKTVECFSSAFSMRSLCFGGGVVTCLLFLGGNAEAGRFFGTKIPIQKSSSYSNAYLTVPEVCKAESHDRLSCISGMSFSSPARSRARVVYGGYFGIQLSPLALFDPGFDTRCGW